MKLLFFKEIQKESIVIIIIVIVIVIILIIALGLWLYYEYGPTMHISGNYSWDDFVKEIGNKCS